MENIGGRLRGRRGKYEEGDGEGAGGQERTG
jgi:hypothetical protein